MATSAGIDAYRKYDFDNDERWQQHLRNTEITDTAALPRVKAKFYAKHVDPDFDPASVAAAPSGRNSTPAGQPPTQQQQAPANDAGVSEGAPQWQHKARRLSENALQTAGGPAGILFVQHVLLVALALLYLQPFSRHLSHAAHTQFLVVALLSHLFKVVLKHGLPQLRPFPAAPKDWVIRAAGTTDFQYALICLVFINQRPTSLLVMIPPLVLAVYHAFAYSSQHFNHMPLWEQYGKPAYTRLIAHQRDAQLLNATVEITIGFQLVVNLFFSGRRNILLAFLYWNILRTRFWSPDCATYHRQVWAKIDERVRPLLQQVPPLEKAVGYAQQWFNGVR